MSSILRSLSGHSSCQDRRALYIYIYKFSGIAMMAYGSQEEEASKPPSYSSLPYQQSPILPKMTRLTVNRPAIRPLGRWQKWTPSNSSSHPLGYYETISLTSENDFEGQDKTGLFEDDEEGKQNISYLSSPLCEKCNVVYQKVLTKPRNQN